MLLGCGLRRSEVAALTVGHVQQRDGRWRIVDLVGKHGRVRTIPMPTWVKVATDAWTTAAGVAGSTNPGVGGAAVPRPEVLGAWSRWWAAPTDNRIVAISSCPPSAKNGRAIGVVRRERARHTVAFLISAGVVPLGRPISSRIFGSSFHQQECDVIDLIRASGKFFDPHKKAFFQRSCSRATLRPDQIAQSLFAKLFRGAILRIGKTVGIDYQDVARMEFERGGLIRR